MSGLILPSKPLSLSVSLSSSQTALRCAASKCKMSEVIEKQRFELESWNYVRLNCRQACVLVHTCHSLGLSEWNLLGHVCPQSLKGLIFSLSPAFYSEWLRWNYYWTLWSEAWYGIPACISWPEILRVDLCPLENIKPHWSRNTFCHVAASQCL